MFDSVAVGEIPADAPAVAGYVHGRFPTWPLLVVEFPHAHQLSIAVQADENDAECLDVEAGDATMVEAIPWVQRALARGVKRPVLYSSLSISQELIDACEHAGIARSQIRIWTAHYTGRAHLCTTACGFGFREPAADATQWTDRALGRNLDESLCNDAFFGPYPDIHNYERFPNVPLSETPIFHERAAIREYDELMKHPALNAKKLAKLSKTLVFLRKRIWLIAHHNPALSKTVSPPRWGDDDLGWRWHELARRTR